MKESESESGLLCTDSTVLHLSRCGPSFLFENNLYLYIYQPVCLATAHIAVAVFGPSPVTFSKGSLSYPLMSGV
jgi:hypothetical protein